MSQQVKIKTQFKNIEHVRLAAEQLGWLWQEGGHVNYYYGTGEKCPYIAEFKHTDEKLKNSPYNMGFQQDKEGYWNIVCDNAMRGPVTNANMLGGETPRIRDLLTRAYAEVSTMAVARQEGHRPQVMERHDDGRVHLRIYGDF